MRLCNYFITTYGVELNHLQRPSAKNLKNNYRKTILSFLSDVQFVT